MVMSCGDDDDDDSGSGSDVNNNIPQHVCVKGRR